MLRKTCAWHQWGEEEREILRILEKKEGINGRSSKVEIFDKYFCCRPGEQLC